MAIQLKLSELLESVPLASWKARIVDIATGVGLKTENWAEGGFSRTLVALSAQLHTAAGEVVRIIAASRFLDFAEGPWLTLLAKQAFNVDRIEATYAAAPLGITLTNTGPKLFIFDAGDIVFAHFTTKRTYRNTIGGTLSPGVGQVLKLDIAADEAGSGGGALVGTITILVTTFLGITCSNTVALVGLDEESDPNLRQRCRDSAAALSVGGIRRAYEFFARSARRPDGSPIGITRVHIPPADGSGTGPVYLAGASGAIPGPDVALVQTIFEDKVTPYGFTATALNATNKSITAPCTIWIPSALGIDAATAKDKVHDALEAYVVAAPIGGVIISPATGKIYWRALLGVVANAIPGTLKAELTSEVDVAIAVSEVPIWGGVLDDTTVNLVS